LPERTVRQLGYVQSIPVPPLVPSEAHRPAKGVYSLSFGTSSYSLTWSRFPYCARVGDQELRLADFPSEAVPEYIDWFRSCTHACVIPGDGPPRGFASADSKSDYVSASKFSNLFTLIYLVV
jgi:hypothetical protein